MNNDNEREQAIALILEEESIGICDRLTCEIAVMNAAKAGYDAGYAARYKQAGQDVCECGCPKERHEIEPTYPCYDCDCKRFTPAPVEHLNHENKMFQNDTAEDNLDMVEAARDEQTVYQVRVAAEKAWTDLYHKGEEVWPVIEQAAINHGFDAALDFATRTHSTRERKLEEQVFKAIDEEPELPDSMREALQAVCSSGDREAMQETLRITVRLTKEGIRKRVQQALAAQEEG